MGEFEIKDLKALKYLNGICKIQGIFRNQRTYILDLLGETGMLGCKRVETPIEPYLKLQPIEVKDVVNKKQYQRHVGKLISHTQPNIAFAMSMVSQFMHHSCLGHFKATYRILRYLKEATGKGLLFKNRAHLSLEVYNDIE